MKLTQWQPALPDHYWRLTPDELDEAIEERRRELGESLVILGHHYQSDEVVRHADFTGDSFKLAQLAAKRATASGANRIIFCGVHFMAESADILTPDEVQVVLPDLAAGCSMADMADIDDVIDAWDRIHASLDEAGWCGRIVPITYMNSTAAIKAFVGEYGGAVCTSSNARDVFAWAMAGGVEPGADEDIKLLFLPDQHLGRNTAAAFGFKTDGGTGVSPVSDADGETCVYDPKKTRQGESLGGLIGADLVRSQVILWAGHCSVHKLFRPEHCDQLRRSEPDVSILVHPECSKEVVDRADLAGSTEFIIRAIDEAPAGSKWVIGTEVHLVHRLVQRAAQRGVLVRSLSECQCMCTTMNRIDEPHLLWTLDQLAQGEVVNRVSVEREERAGALTALERMLALKTTTQATPSLAVELQA